MRPFGPLLLATALAIAPACGDSASAPTPTADTAASEPDATVDDAEAPAPPEAIAGTWAGMDFTRADDPPLYAAPFPSADLRDDDGAIALPAIPVDPDAALMNVVIAIGGAREGFGRTSAAYVAFDGPLDPATLPDVFGSVLPGAAVALVDVDPGSPHRGAASPALVHFEADGGPFGAPNLLGVLPLQGVPLRAATTYAVVVTRAVTDADGAALGVPLSMAQLAAGVRPDGLSDAAWAAYDGALEELAEAGWEPGDLAALAVFTTGDPEAELAEWVDHALASPLPVPLEPAALTDVFDTFCVLETTLEMPVYQHGDPPFDDGGGGWLRDDAGAPLPSGTETARMVVTLPRAEAPADGWPLAVFVRTGGGGDRPLVDRGPRAEPGGEAIEPGTGPALHFAAAGWAGVSIDGPHGGLRNVTGGDEQFLMFNVTNPLALRDNVRQSALELVVAAHLVEGLELDASACEGTSALARFDVDHMVLMGHSMGATIGPLAVAAEPRFDALLLSGAGGSWIENLVWKESPIAVKPAAELLLGYLGVGRELHRHDAAVSLLQWAGEAADPPVYARRIVHEPGPEGPRHVLMMQGIVDTYILPPIANALSLALGLDLGGPELDADHADLGAHAPLADHLPLVGQGPVTLPVTGNAPGGVTAVVMQYPEDGIEDGHEVVFQTAAPQGAYRCFLAGLLQGAPAATLAGCD